MNLKRLKVNLKRLKRDLMLFKVNLVTFDGFQGKLEARVGRFSDF